MHHLNDLLAHLLTYKFTYSLLTSTLHRFDSELDQLAAKMGGTGGEEGGNAPVFGRTVQARLPPVPARHPPHAINGPYNTHRPHTVTGTS